MGRKTSEEKQLNEQAAQILEAAKRMGVQDNFYFRTTFERYMTQLRIMDGLREAIDRDGMTTERTYVKGSSNLYANPAINDYNRTANAANSTVKTLMAITRQFGERNVTGAEDLVAFINGK